MHAYEYSHKRFLSSFPLTRVVKSFATYLHGKGMQLSVYSDAGKLNCCGEPGSLGYEDIDTATFAAWGADAVGVDYCGGPANVEEAYRKFADGIVKTGRAMQLEIWNLGRGDAQKWAPTLSRNMTAKSAPGHGAFAPHIRLTGDIGNYWSGKIGNTESLLNTVDQIQCIADLWSYGMGNTSGTFPNYGQVRVLQFVPVTSVHTTYIPYIAPLCSHFSTPT